MRKLLTTFVLCVTVPVVAVVLVSASPAGAHAELREADPAPGGTTSVGTDEVELVVITMDPDEPVDVVVTGPDGSVVNAGEPRIDDVAPTGVTVRVPVEPLEEGPHTVEWSATSTDGDGRTEDRYEFEVEPAAGGGVGIWLVWIVALGIPALIFLRPGARRRSRSS